jgi:predicted MFS family arabinose efflux permease
VTTGRRSQLDKMNPREIRAAFSLSGIFMLRMLGLFLILPVFALYAEHLEGVTPARVGLAIGAYGLTQAILQIPFGMLSDRFGRKPIIVLGLVLFALGSVVAAVSQSIDGVILGRMLQGSGAIAAAVMALAADLTREEQRTKIMAVIGVSIGVSFALALVLAPLLDAWIGVPGIFWMTAVLALAGIAVVYLVVPDPEVTRVHRDAEPVAGQFREVLRDGQLLRLDFGILALHTILTASFVVMPIALRDFAGLPAAQHWAVYLPVLVLSVIAMIPFIILAERHRRMKRVFAGAVLVLGLAQLGLAQFHADLVSLAVMLFVFFTAFNLLEASLPSLVSKTAPPESKGTAMGVYSTSQFLGAFLGGAGGGLVYGALGLEGVFLFCAVVAGVWFLVALSMRNPRYLSSYVLKVGVVSEEEARHLTALLTRVRGVAEATVDAAEGVAYLKVDHKALDEPALREFSAAEA